MTALQISAQQALDALEYHVEQTRPIWKTSEAIATLRTALAQEPVATLGYARKIEELIAQRDALLEALKEADDLLRIARGAMWKLRLNGLGSDCRLSHEVRMFALDFSAESRDGPGVLQVNGTGRLQKALASIRAAITKATGEPA